MFPTRPRARLSRPRKRTKRSRTRTRIAREKALKLARDREIKSASSSRDPSSNSDPVEGSSLSLGLDDPGLEPQTQDEIATNSNPSSPAASTGPKFEEVFIKPSPPSSPSSPANSGIDCLSSSEPATTWPEKNCLADCTPTRRIINLAHFTRELMYLGEHPLHCPGGSYQLVQEIIRQLESDFMYSCYTCGASCTISTDPELESINDAFISGGVSMGIQYSQLQEVLTIAELPQMSEIKYNNKESSFHMNFDLPEMEATRLICKEERETDF